MVVWISYWCFGDSARTVDILVARVRPERSDTTSRPVVYRVRTGGGGAWRSTYPLKPIHGMVTRRYVLSVDNDNEFRPRCE
jgi:hypothetical protein